MHGMSVCRHYSRSNSSSLGQQLQQQQQPCGLVPFGASTQLLGRSRACCMRMQQGVAADQELWQAVTTSSHGQQQLLQLMTAVGKGLHTSSAASKSNHLGSEAAAECVACWMQLLQASNNWAGVPVSGIYNTSNLHGMSVFDRLTADASVRENLKSITASALPPPDYDSFASLDRTAALTAAAAAVAGMDKPCQPTSCETRKAEAYSGWVGNNNINLVCKQQQADSSCTKETPLSALHPITLRSFYKKHPIDFLAAARPQARTTTETLRMMGAYSSDKAVAEQLGMYVPNACSSAKLTLQ